jgi:hypothetical protein
LSVEDTAGRIGGKMNKHKQETTSEQNQNQQDAFN